MPQKYKRKDGAKPYLDIWKTYHQFWISHSTRDVLWQHIEYRPTEKIAHHHWSSNFVIGNRDKWIDSFKRRRSLTASEVNKIFPNSKVYVTEHLPPENKILLAKIKQKCKELEYKYVLVKVRKILIRKAEVQRCFENWAYWWSKPY